MLDVAASADPNWFYSTLAQSTAAIVGLAGALLVSWTLARRTELASERTSLRGRFVSWLQNQQGIREGFVSTEELTRAMWGVIEPQQDNPEGIDLGDSPAYSLLGGFVPGRSVGPGSWADAQHAAALPGIAHAAATAFTWDAATLAAALDSGPPFPTGGVAWIAEPRETDDSPANAAAFFWRSLAPAIQRDAVRGQWGAQTTALAELQSDYLALRSRIIPRSVYVLVAILIGLLAVGVIAPLSYLHAESGNSKPVLLGVFAVLASAFGGYLVLEINRLRRAADLTKDWF